MGDRLIELLNQINFDYCEECVCASEDGYKGAPDLAEFFADRLLAEGVIVLPCKVGDWIWYVYQNTINKAKVEEIKYDASKHGYYSYSFDVHAYDFKNKREVSYYPINETTKNDANINEVERMDWDEEVLVFLTREEAERALERSENGK